MSVSVAHKASLVCGEGPHWEESSRSLLYVDIDNGEIHRWSSITGEDTTYKLDGLVGFAIPRASGGYIVGNDRKISLVDLQSGSESVIHEVEPQGSHPKKYRFNDAKCDPSGRLWAGTMTWPPEDTPHCKLYSLDHDRNLKLQSEDFHLTNGMAWTSDSKTMFLVDTSPRKIYAFDYDISSGNVSNKRVAVDFDTLTSIPDYTWPDGCCMDTNDKLWVACARAGKVAQIDTTTATVLRTVDIPCGFVASCCFGGDQYEDLYVTTGVLSGNNKQVPAGPLGGSVFRVTGLNVKGIPPNVYTG